MTLSMMDQCDVMLSTTVLGDASQDHPSITKVAVRVC